MSTTQSRLRQLLQPSRLATVLVALAMTLLLPLFGTTGTASAAPADCVDNGPYCTSQSIVQLNRNDVATLLEPDGSIRTVTAEQSVCTAWFSDNRGHMVTAGHCADAATAQEDYQRQLDTASEPNPYTDESSPSALTPPLAPVVIGYQVHLTAQQSFITDPAERCIPQPTPVLVDDVSNFSDLALLHVSNGKPCQPLALMPAHTAHVEGDKVTAIGFNGDEVLDPTQNAPTNPEDGSTIQPLDQLLTNSTVLPSFVTTSVSARQQPSLSYGPKPHSTVIELSNKLAHGSSGGPVLDDNNNVVGDISFGSLTDDQSFIVDTDDLRSFLTSNGALTEPDPADSTPSKTAEQSTPDTSFYVKAWGIIVVAALGLLVIGYFVGYFVAKERHNRRSQPAATNHQGSSTPTGPALAAPPSEMGPQPHPDAPDGSLGRPPQQ